LGRVRSFFGEKPPGYVDMVPHLRLVYAFSCSPVKPLRLAMLCHKSLPTLIETLNLINVDTTSYQSPARDTCVWLCYFSFIEALQSANGATWITQALDAGFLFVALKLGA
jgi:hypothetical protein